MFYATLNVVDRRRVVERFVSNLFCALYDS